MIKATLEYDLPSQREQFELAQKGEDYRIACGQIIEYMTKIQFEEDLTAIESRRCNAVKQEIMFILDQYRLDY